MCVFISSFSITVCLPSAEPDFHLAEKVIGCEVTKIKERAVKMAADHKQPINHISVKLSSQRCYRSITFPAPVIAAQLLSRCISHPTTSYTNTHTSSHCHTISLALLHLSLFSFLCLVHCFIVKLFNYFYAVQLHVKKEIMTVTWIFMLLFKICLQ